MLNLILEIAADLNIDLNAKDNQGLTAFHWVCLRGDTELAKILVKNSKLDSSARDNSGSTSFHYACRYAHSEIAELLIENHANLNIELDAKDNEGWTGFHWACIKGKVIYSRVLSSGSLEERE